MSRRAYSDETKAAVMAALLTGQSVASVAREYKLPKGTVKRWKSEASDPGSNHKKQRIGALLLAYVEGALVALEAQTRVFRDESWVRKQPASEVAVLHGVVADKVTRILEALAGDDSEDDAGV